MNTFNLDITKLARAQTLLNGVMSGNTPDDKIKRALLRAAEIAADAAAGSTAPISLSPVSGLFDDFSAATEDLPMVGLTRTDGQDILYAGELTWLTAEPGSGKSLVTTAASLDMARNGTTVLYLDYESTQRVFTRRLAQLGAVQDDAANGKLHYVDMSTSSITSVDEFGAAVAGTANAVDAQLIVIDGFSVLLSGLGLDENSNSDNSLVGRKLLDIVAGGDRSVLVIDHIGKPNENNKSTSGKRYSRGASSKLAVPALALMVEVAVAPSVGKPGILHWTIAKDRHGMLGAVGSRVATIHLLPEDRGEIVGGLTVKVDSPENSGSERPLFLDGVARKIMKLLDNGPRNKGELRDGMNRGSWQKYGVDTMTDLIEYGFVVEEKGRGPERIYRKVNPLTQEDIERINADKLAEKMGVENPF